MGKIAGIYQILQQFSNNIWQAFFDIREENIDNRRMCQKIREQITLDFKNFNVILDNQTAYDLIHPVHGIPESRFVWAEYRKTDCLYSAISFENINSYNINVRLQ